ncbi:oxidoreductase [Roseicyclus amphidinii]|uniref:oxidoreductase n=1 Tax=Roseicyclus amphidinii TaxID=3034232 RepID=UPI0024E1095F|nr:oxidoreductase [Roseicyclus sp. Amp-Y-6]
MATAASALEPARGDVLLTVSGAIGQTNAGDEALLDLELLVRLGTTEFETETIWTDGPQTFVGVELVDLLAALEAEGDILRAVALNDYAVEIPVSDAVEGGPIIAFLRNGEEMSVRDKGPLWLVYPYDNVAEYRSEVTYARSIWQLARIEVQP